ncbi:MAG TPA: efflux RND transporter periplasmic adaptor subunit, partial [Thermoanaerobaculia bacterium]|nr:efflux RND transporter periplasmic adaptor subunit [Thermoanaerobaculia bacterium]
MTSLVSNSRLALAAALLAAACSPSRDVPSSPASVSTTTELVRSTEVPDVRVTTGTVRASTVSTLSAKVLGNVTRVLVNEGDRVRAGQLLVQIDDRDVRAKTDQARAAWHAMDDAIASATAAVTGAEANANFAKATYDRFAVLRERGSVSPHEFEEVAARQTAAQADAERAKGERERLFAQRAQAGAGVAEAETFLSYTRVTSPTDGVITARFIDPGAQAAPGVPLVAVEGAGAYRVETTVDEELATRIHVGDRVLIDGAAARVSHIAPVDALTRSAFVKIDLPPQTAHRSGTFVHVSFSIGTRRSLIVPATAVVRHGQIASVFVVDDRGTARMRLVTLG